MPRQTFLPDLLVYFSVYTGSSELHLRMLACMEKLSLEKAVPTEASVCGGQFLQRSKPYLVPPGSLERLNVTPLLFPSQLQQFLRKPSAVCGPLHRPNPPAWHPFLTVTNLPLYGPCRRGSTSTHTVQPLEERPLCTDAQVTATNLSRALATSCFTAHPSHLLL